MRTKIKNSIVLCSIVLMCNNSFSQGIFDFDNNTNCDVEAKIYAYNNTGGCDIDSCDSPCGDSGWILCRKNSRTNLSGSLSFPNCSWGRIDVKYSGNTIYNGEATCFSQYGSVSCSGDSPKVSWLHCHHATLP